MRVALVAVVVCAVVALAGYLGARTNSSDDGFNLTGGTQTISPIALSQGAAACVRDAKCRRAAEACLRNSACVLGISESTQRTELEADGATIVFAVGGAQHGLYALNPLSHREYRLTHGPDREPRWSPDGRFIAFLRGPPAAIWILDYRSGSIHRVAAGRSPVWSSTGTTLYFMCYVQRLCARQQPTAVHGRVVAWPLPLLASGLERVTNSQFVLATLGEGLWIWSIGARARQLTPGVLDIDLHPRVSPDGTTLLFTRLAEDGQSDIESFNLRTGKTQNVSHSGGYYADDTASWIPKSNRIVFVRSRLHRSELRTWTTNAVIETMTRHGQVLSRLKAVEESVVDLDWRP